MLGPCPTSTQPRQAGVGKPFLRLRSGGFRALTRAGLAPCREFPQNAPVRAALPRADRTPRQTSTTNDSTLRPHVAPRPPNKAGRLPVLCSVLRESVRHRRCRAARELKKAHARSVVFADRADAHYAVIKDFRILADDAFFDFRPLRFRASTLRPVSSAAQKIRRRLRPRPPTRIPGHCDCGPLMRPPAAGRGRSVLRGYPGGVHLPLNLFCLDL